MGRHPRAAGDGRDFRLHRCQLRANWQAGRLGRVSEETMTKARNTPAEPPIVEPELPKAKPIREPKLPDSPSWRDRLPRLKLSRPDFRTINLRDFRLSQL